MVKSHFEDHKLARESFYTVRDSISLIVRGCYTDVQVAIYFDDVLADPLVVKVGAGNNKLIISIREDKIYLTWTKVTWSKAFSDGLEKIKEFTIKILSSLADALSKAQITGEVKLSISP